MSDDYAGWSPDVRPDVWDDYARLADENWDEHVQARREGERVSPQLCWAMCGRTGASFYSGLCVSCHEQRRQEREEAA